MAQGPNIIVDKKVAQAVTVQFEAAYGRTLAWWAGVERSLFRWFVIITSMPENLARAIFYGARSFIARAEMLEAAIDHAHGQTKEEIEFVKAGIKKARQYSEFRNRLAHGEMAPFFDIESKQMTMTVTETKKLDFKNLITIEHLQIASINFYKLQLHIFQAMPDRRAKSGLSLEQHRAIVLALPNQANEKSAPTAEAQETSRESQPRRNKKEYREAQRTAKKPPSE
jgi:hypothetical protein